MATDPNDPTIAAYTTRWQRRDRYLASAASDQARELLQLAFGSDDPISDADAELLASIREVTAIHEGATESSGSIYQPRRYDFYEATLRDDRRITFGIITKGYSEGYSFELRPHATDGRR